MKSVSVMMLTGLYMYMYVHHLSYLIIITDYKETNYHLGNNCKLAMAIGPYTYNLPYIVSLSQHILLITVINLQCICLSIEFQIPSSLKPSSSTSVHLHFGAFIYRCCIEDPRRKIEGMDNRKRLESDQIRYPSEYSRDSISNCMVSFMDQFYQSNGIDPVVSYTRDH